MTSRKAAALPANVPASRVRGVELNLSRLLDQLADEVPDRTSIRHHGVSISAATLRSRSRRLARLLAERGLSEVTERDGNLAGHESGQQLLGQCLLNGVEYFEGLFGSYRARVAPFNINYRYVGDEIRYLVENARPGALQYHARFAPAVAEALVGLSRPPLLLQVADSSGNALLPGALDYESAVAAQPDDDLADIEPSPDDLYVLYTGGTTGMPKAVLWRQADVAIPGLSVFDRATGNEWASYDARVPALHREPAVSMTCAPLIHGAAQWMSLGSLLNGGTIVLPDEVERFDAAEVLDTIEREGVISLTIVGDAFAGAILDVLARRSRPRLPLRFLFTGGAALRPAYRNALIDALPGLRIFDLVGASESGQQGRVERSERSDGRHFALLPDAAVVSEDRARFLDPGHEGLGWLAKRGRVPLGYLGDAAKTAETFPLVDGERVSVPGDRARLVSADEFELLGRDSVTINTGGEKVFAEEVEFVLKRHPAVHDAVVCGRASERWGQEVIALVALRRATKRADSDLEAHCRQHLAGYKTPRSFVLVDQVVRQPSGKVDYQWAQRLVEGESNRQQR
jgi:fatty-acyl-CoA synthase